MIPTHGKYREKGGESEVENNSVEERQEMLLIVKQDCGGSYDLGSRATLVVMKNGSKRGNH